MAPEITDVRVNPSDETIGLGPQYFREAAEVMKATAGGPPDRARMVELMLRHGLTPAP